MVSTKIDKGLKISIPILVVVVVSAIVVTILMNNKSSNIDTELNQETSITNSNEKENKMAKIYANFNNEKLEINLEENSTTSALVKLLPLDITMNDLNKNEKYAYLDKSLPTNTYSPKHIEAGDVMLFGDNCLVIFYESFDTSYSYSKIGHIDNLPELGNESISIKLSME
ncbi:hypothetical protein IKF34_03000 [Candidatus Saccharibacteria bacterium]|nr:hypothetical protein [Candidatus Saccharibacteria bacterium]